MSRPMPDQCGVFGQALGFTSLYGEDDCTRLPSNAGSYGLLIGISQPVQVDVHRLGCPVLPAGLYLYCGSAKGPGGIRSRVTRHLKPDKSLRWHVDHLTKNADEIAGFPLTGAGECDLLERALRIPGATVPVSGFGSSDCRRCPGHLVLLRCQSVIVRRSVDLKG